jgi:hypothetical protein
VAYGLDSPQGWIESRRLKVTLPDDIGAWRQRAEP